MIKTKKKITKFKCSCGGQTEQVWTSKDGKTVGCRCINGHYENTNNGKNRSFGYPVTLVPIAEAL